MNKQKLIGLLFILGVMGVVIPYTVLTSTFDYPDILRQDAGEILTRYHQGGASLIFTWWLFAILGLPMLSAYIQLGGQLEAKSSSARWITSIGVIGLVAQIVGLLRWTFVVPVIANNYVNGDPTSREISRAVFDVVHQFGGVLLGEHLGQLFTIIWIVGITRLMQKMKIVPRWITWLGYLSSVIYLTAQGDLFATVIPTFPVWEAAGFLGSSFWLVWLISIGSIFFARSRDRRLISLTI